MQKTLALFSLSLGITLGNPGTPILASTEIPAVNQTKGTPPQRQEDLLGLDEQLWGNLSNPGDRQALLASIDNSLRYLQTVKAAETYQKYPDTGITRDRVVRSLVRFRQLVVSSKSAQELQNAVRGEFVFYQSVGNDNKGTVVFTGYYEPIYQASRTRTAEYRYPLYKLPSNFAAWPKPHPKREQLEGKDGLLGAKSPLHGQELVWLRDRLEAFLVQIQGSAQLQMRDGTVMTVGYAGGTDYPYTSVGRELAKDGKLPLDGLTLPVLIKYFQQNPLEMSNYIPRNQRFVFFQETYGSPAMGVINVPVTPDRSIATDKSLMPPGALALVHTRLPYVNSAGKIEQRLVSRYVLDQDTGSAIKGPGRVDYYMGSGKVAGDRAGVTGGPGQLYYLLLKE
ncbi:MAG: murein transglycosylase A [Aphanothece sp. CMT-3BRIN-NPC111]|jgi:membrane-bound lytic murein transglycosylase A|nr:murein transglycosylase A [Aphanothece sp. CMT-3BRIN-NPC111]